MQYEIRTINDLLKVPAEQRGVCLREIQYSLALHELAYGVGSDIGIELICWADDGQRTMQLADERGEEVLTMRLIPTESTEREDAAT